jgi:hypothetical protein
VERNQPGDRRHRRDAGLVMALKGDFSELSGFLKKLQKLPDASREIAVALAPKTAALVGETMAAQTGPNGEPWPATKSGSPAFGGSSALGYVLSRLSGKSTVRTTVLYPLHFHQDGTHKIGRKRGRKIASKYLGDVLKSLGFKGGMPRRRKGESDEAYAARVQKAQIARDNRARAVKELKSGAAAKVEEAREAGGWHDPPRPMIPDEGAAIPATWNDTIVETATEVMARYGAEAR